MAALTGTPACSDVEIPYRHATEKNSWRPVVDLGPRLLHGTPGAHDGARSHRLTARVAQLSPGLVDMRTVAPDPARWLGLLVLDGLIVVEAEAGRARVGWLVGTDDLVRPWDMAEASLTAGTAWRVLAPTCVALLDGDFSRRAAGLAAVTRALVARIARTTSWLLAKSLVVSCPVVEERLLLLFALLGERWGVVTPEGIVLRIALTHGLLATLCGARRPSVTLALRSLVANGVVTRVGRSRWLLRHHPAWRTGCLPTCWTHYTSILGLEAPAEAGTELTAQSASPLD